MGEEGEDVCEGGLDVGEAGGCGVGGEDEA